MAYVPPNKRAGYVPPPRKPTYTSTNRYDPYEESRRQREYEQQLELNRIEREREEIRLAIANVDETHFPSLGGGGQSIRQGSNTNGSFAEQAKQWELQRIETEKRKENERIKEEERLERIARKEREDAQLRRTLIPHTTRKQPIKSNFVEEMHLSNEDDEWTTVKPKERKIKKFNYDDIPEEESKKKEDENDYPVYDAEYDGY